MSRLCFRLCKGRLANQGKRCYGKDEYCKSDEKCFIKDYPDCPIGVYCEPDE